MRKTAVRTKVNIGIQTSQSVGEMAVQKNVIAKNQNPQNNQDHSEDCCDEIVLSDRQKKAIADVLSDIKKTCGGEKNVVYLNFDDLKELVLDHFENNYSVEEMISMASPQVICKDMSAMVNFLLAHRVFRKICYEKNVDAIILRINTEDFSLIYKKGDDDYPWGRQW